MSDLDKKINFALFLLRNIPQDSGPVEIAYSTGKDSDVILQLAKEAGIPYRAIYKNTSIDPPGSIQHAREMGAEIIFPKPTFLQMIGDHGFPNRWRRWCCSKLKEYKVCDRAVQGIRRCESLARAKRYKEPEVCRTYSKKEKVRIYLPILEWSNEDVETFIRDRGIRCHPEYYDEEGVFHVERRVGCIGCPLKSDCGKGDFKRFPRMAKAWIRGGGGAHRKTSGQHPAADHKPRPIRHVLHPPVLLRQGRDRNRTHGRTLPGDAHRLQGVPRGLFQD